MRCHVVFSHPDKSTQYLFVDLKDTPDGLKPIGCFMLRRYRDKACVFETKGEADRVVAYLLSIGCKAYSRKVTSGFIPRIAL